MKDMRKDRVRYYADKETLLKDISDMINQGDVVLVKASRSMFLEEVVKEILKDK